jgi:hypothetical protein
MAISLNQNCVNNVERTMLEATIAQPLQNWLLCALGRAPEGFIHEAAFLGLGGQTGRTAQVRLIS